VFVATRFVYLDPHTTNGDGQMQQAERFAYEVGIEAAPTATQEFRQHRLPIVARDADEAQELAVAEIEGMGFCHRHVLYAVRVSV